MSEIKTDLAWVPPPFPAQGRLPVNALTGSVACSITALFSLLFSLLF